MPVRFEKSSEYNKWLESQGATVPPQSMATGGAHALHQSMAAGVTTSARTAEPSLQRRRKPEASSADQADGGDYFLLGSNNKFSTNIRYKTKRKVHNHHDHVENGASAEVRNGDQNNHDNINVPSSQERKMSPPAAPRVKSPPQKTAPPAPRVVVQPGAPKPRHEERFVPPAPKVSVDPGAPVGRSKPAIVKHSVATETKPEPAQSKKDPKRTKSEKVRAERPKDIKEMAKMIQSGPPKVVQSKKEAKHTKSEKVRSERPRDPREMARMVQEKVNKELKRKDVMNEYSQADLDKGVLDSGQEASANYAMKYRAGMAPARPRGPKRVSEYQLQFQWKDSANSSPLLAAEQVVYNSNPQLVAPSKQETVPKLSEYRKQFQAWPVQQSVDYAMEGPSKKAKLKKSKSEESLVADRPAAGLTKVTSSEDKRVLKDSLNPQRLHFPHGRPLKNKRSEYDNNFQPPSKFLYEGGAWRGAYPPHLEPRKEEVLDVVDNGAEPSDSRVPSSASSWYGEVVELRKKAEEYKKRAQGTHFSREHMAQLYAKQAELWDTASTSSILSALSLEQGSDIHQKKTKKGKRALKHPQPAENVKRAWDEEEELRSISSRGRGSSIGSIPSPRSVSDAGTLVDDEDEGRVPTPTMKQREKSHTVRHHLDRTTPAVGGALLTSPAHRALAGQKMSPMSAGTYSVRSQESEDDSPQVPEITKSRPAPQPGHFTKPSRAHGSQKTRAVEASQRSVSSGSSGQPAKVSSSAPAVLSSNQFEPHCTCGAEDGLDDHMSELRLGEDAGSRNGYEKHRTYVKKHSLRNEGTKTHSRPKPRVNSSEPLQPASVASSQDSRHYRLTKENYTKSVPGVSREPSGSSRSDEVVQTKTYGMPTRDTHVLLDEEASVDRPLRTDYVHSPEHRQAKRERPAGIPSTIREEMADTYNQPKWGIETAVDYDDDALSTSVRSLASSCSLASEVLDRARNRREEFWGH